MKYEDSFQPDQPDASPPAGKTARFRGKTRSAFAAPPQPSQDRPGRVDSKIRNNRRKLVAKILSDGDESAIDVMVDRMRMFVRRARSVEKMVLESNIETAEDREQILAFSAAAIDAATRVAPYLHARLAPKLAKGETGTQINLIIEDA